MSEKELADYSEWLKSKNALRKADLSADVLIWATKCAEKGIAREDIIRRFIQRTKEKPETFTSNEVLYLIERICCMS